MEENCQHWYALYTKPRHEKIVESELLQKNIEVFTPKIKLRRKWSDRIKIVEEPLFKSYCFARFALDKKFPIVAQRGVVNIVNFNRNYVTVPISVIESLRALLLNEVPVNPYPYLHLQDKITITKGPLRGVEGYIVEKRNKDMSLVVSVDAIRSSIQCIVDVDCVEPA